MLPESNWRRQRVVMAIEIWIGAAIEFVIREKEMCKWNVCLVLTLD